MERRPPSSAPRSPADVATNRANHRLRTETLDIGEDSGTPVVRDYDVPFRFTGELHQVIVDLLERPLQITSPDQPEQQAAAIATFATRTTRAGCGNLIPSSKSRDDFPRAPSLVWP